MSHKKFWLLLLAGILSLTGSSAVAADSNIGDDPYIADIAGACWWITFIGMILLVRKQLKTSESMTTNPASAD